MNNRTTNTVRGDGDPTAQLIYTTRHFPPDIGAFSVSNLRDLFADFAQVQKRKSSTVRERETERVEEER